MDSLPEAIAGLETIYDRWGRGWSNLCARAFLRELNRLRALRERDEKRWEIVREVEQGIGSALGFEATGTVREPVRDVRHVEWTKRLRDAREGRDA